MLSNCGQICSVSFKLDLGFFLGAGSGIEGVVIKCKDNTVLSFRSVFYLQMIVSW